MFRSRHAIAASIAVTVTMLVPASVGAAAAKPTVGAAQLKSNAVTTAKLKNGAVTGAKIAKGTITGANLNAAFVQGLATPASVNASISSALGAYAKTGDLTAFLKQSDLAPYAKSADLAPYAKTTDMTTAIDAAVDNAINALPVDEYGTGAVFWDPAGVDAANGFVGAGTPARVHQFSVGAPAFPNVGNATGSYGRTISTASASFTFSCDTASGMVESSDVRIGGDGYGGCPIWLGATIRTAGSTSADGKARAIATITNTTTNKTLVLKYGDEFAGTWKSIIRVGDAEAPFDPELTDLNTHRLAYDSSTDSYAGDTGTATFARGETLAYGALAGHPENLVMYVDKGASYVVNVTFTFAR